MIINNKLELTLALKPSSDSSRDSMSFEISLEIGESNLRDFLDRFFSEVDAVVSASPEEPDFEKSGGESVETDAILNGSGF